MAREFEIDLFIPGVPRSTQIGGVVRISDREGNEQAIPVQRNTPWSAYCALVAKVWGPPLPMLGPLTVVATFYLRTPKSKQRDEWPARRPDLDNLTKGIADAMNGILWQDDSQIVRLVHEKHWDVHNEGQPGVRLQVRPREARVETARGALVASVGGANEASPAGLRCGLDHVFMASDLVVMPGQPCRCGKRLWPGKRTSAPAWLA